MHIILINESKTNKMYFFFRRIFDFWLNSIHFTIYISHFSFIWPNMWTLTFWTWFSAFIFAINQHASKNGGIQIPKQKEEEEMKQTKIFAQSCSRFITGKCTHAKNAGRKFTYDTLKNNFTYLIESNRIELNWIDQRKDVLHRLVIYSYNFISNDYRNEEHQR